MDSHTLRAVLRRLKDASPWSPPEIDEFTHFVHSSLLARRQVLQASRYHKEAIQSASATAAREAHVEGSIPVVRLERGEAPRQAGTVFFGA